MGREVREHDHARSNRVVFTIFGADAKRRSTKRSSLNGRRLVRTCLRAATVTGT